MWLLNRAGGEAIKITDVKGSVTDHVWSPNAKQLALVVKDPNPLDPEPEKEPEKRPDGTTKTAKPIVIDRYYFKADVDGYLRGERSHIYVFDLESKKALPLTPGNFNEDSPAWSPDGSASRSSAATATAMSTRRQTATCSWPRHAPAVSPFVLRLRQPRNGTAGVEPQWPVDRLPARRPPVSDML